MTETAQVCIAAYPGFELLDLCGPATVFATANKFLGRRAYRTTPVSSNGGYVESFEGVTINTSAIRQVRPRAEDTVIVTGGFRSAVEAACNESELLEWIREARSVGSRIASVCTGSFVLASAGIAERRTVATHWAACDDFTSAYPEVDLNEDAIYVEDEGIWTSAGVTSGIDMALAMLERDHGSEARTFVSRMLVVYSHRPGNQSQFSDVLRTQARTGHPFEEAIRWIDENISQPIRVADLAKKAGMSERTFFRRFSAAVGESPARFIENVRLSRARDLLQAGMPVKQTAGAVGYRSEAAFRTAFASRFGTTPTGFRSLHREHPAN